MPLSLNDLAEKARPGEAVLISVPPKFLIDITTEMGKASGAFYGFIFNLPKWGFESFKVDEGLYVSPGFAQAYQLTIQQKNQLEEQIKKYAADVARAISDVELLLHDLRKYKEFLDYFSKIEEGKLLLEKAKKEKDPKKREELEEEGKKKIKEGEIALRSVFIDQVDVHTGDVYSLLGMARGRWPTIISDFMQLEEEKSKEEIKRKIPSITDAEAIVLAKKNILYLEWKKMFFDNVKTRYLNIRRMLAMRKASVDKYKEMLIPLIKKYESYKEWIPHPKTSWAKPASQAQFIETTKLWIWKAIPFEYEPFKPIMNLDQNEINLANAGYDEKEIKELKNSGIEKTVNLPIEPSVDEIVRKGLNELKKEYGDFDIILLEEARKELSNRIYKPEITQERWRPSPFYAFFEVEMNRTVFRLPNGIQIEDLEVTMVPNLVSQNLMLLKIVEMKLIEKRYEKEIEKFLGEVEEVKKNGEKLLKSLEESIKEEYPFIFGEEKNEKREEEKIKPRKKHLLLVLDEKIRKFSSKIFGFEVGLLHSYGPYSYTYADQFFSDYVIDNSTLFKTFFFSALGIPL